MALSMRHSEGIAAGSEWYSSSAGRPSCGVTVSRIQGLALPGEVLEIGELCPVGDDAGSDIENSSSSSSREFDEGVIAQAAGGGILACGVATGWSWTAGLDAQPALASGNSSRKASVLSLGIVQVLGVLVVGVSKPLLGGLLLFERCGGGLLRLVGDALQVLGVRSPEFRVSLVLGCQLFAVAPFLRRAGDQSAGDC